MGSTTNTISTEEYFKNMLELSNEVEDSEEYQRAKQKYQYMQKELDELDIQIDALRNQLEKEEVRGEEYEEAVKTLGRALANMFIDYTDKGYEIQKELLVLIDKRDTLSNSEDTGTLDLAEQSYKRKQNEAFRLEKDIFDKNRPALVDARSTVYPGFRLTTNSGMDSYLKDGSAKIVEMSPREYLERISYDIFSHQRGGYFEAITTLRKSLQGTSLKNIKRYAKDMKKGKKYDMPFLDYTGSRGQEGRHRALAAIINGYEKIPVLVRL